MPHSTTAIFAKKNMFVVLVVASALLLTAGCAQEVGLGGVAGGDAGSGNSNSDGNGGSGDDKDGESDDAAHANLTGKTCFPGTWIADNTDIQSYMEAASGGASISTTGQVIITYNPDGTAVNNYDHWTNTIKIAGATSVVERHGIDKGTYTVTDEGTFTASDTSVVSVTKMTATAPGGEKITMTIDNEPSVFNKGKYTCSGDVLTMTVDGYDLKLFRER